MVKIVFWHLVLPAAALCQMVLPPGIIRGGSGGGGAGACAGALAGTYPGCTLAGLSGQGSVLFQGSTSGVGTSDSTNLVWDAVNSRLLLRRATTTESAALGKIGGAAGSAALYLGTVSIDASNTYTLARIGGGDIALNAPGTNNIVFSQAGTVRGIVGSTTGDFVWGDNATDGNYKLDVTSSGSGGSLRVWDRTPTTGATSFVLRMGSGQGAASPFIVQDSATAASLSAISPAGSFIAGGSTSSSATSGLSSAGLLMASSSRVLWSGSTPGVASGYDVGLSRTGAGSLELNTGTNGQNGTTLTLGSLVAYNNTPTTGVTNVVLRNGPGQGSVVPLEFLNSSATRIGYVGPVAEFVNRNSYHSTQNSIGSLNEVAIGNIGSYLGVSLASGRGVRWSSTTDASGAKDLGIERTSAGVVEINSGTTGTYGAGLNVGAIGIFNNTPTTGVTSATVRAGAGQGGTALITLQDNAGSTQTTLGSDVTASGALKAGSFVQAGATSTLLWLTRSRMTSPADGVVLFENQANSAFTGLQLHNDTGIYRNAAGVLEINTGTAGAYNTQLRVGSTLTYNNTPTTGVTSATVRAGAGQGGNPLSVWQNNAGSTLATVDNNGNFVGVGLISGTSMIANSSGVALANSVPILFSSTSWAGGAADLGMSRSAAGLLEVNSGTAGDLRDLKVRTVIAALTTPSSSSATCTAGTWTADGGYIYICTAANTWKRAALSTF